MSGTDIGIAIVPGKHVLSGPFPTKQARAQATYDELNRVISLFTQAGFIASARPESKWDYGFILAPGPNIETLLGFPPERIHIRHHGGALLEPFDNAPRSRKCPLCHKPALADWTHWQEVFDLYGDNNLKDSPIFSREPQIDCANCGQSILFTSLGCSIEDTAAYYGGTVEDCLRWYTEAEGPPTWGRMLGRVIIEASGWDCEFDESRVAQTLEALLGWKNVSSGVIYQ